MIALELLDVDEATAAVEESIQEFIIERLPVSELTDDGTRKMRSALRQRLMTEGLPRGSHCLAAIISEGVNVGRVWFGPLDGDDTAVYVYDIRVAADHRRNGYARAAMQLIVDHAAHCGARRVGLSVAHANAGAIDLYESLGFVTRHTDDFQREMWTEVDHGSNLS